VIRRQHTEPHDGPCSFDPVFGVEKVRKSDGANGLSIFCRCGKWEYVTISPEPAQEEKIRFWRGDSSQPILWAGGILLIVVVVVNNNTVRDLAVYPIHLLMLGASFMCARAVYKFLDPTWDQRKQNSGDKISMNWRAFVTALLIFFAVGIFLESLPTHRMANSFSHEALDE
jgi:hypothetical protein